jgi:myo-inositol-1(or 4)-monophosphatase
MEECLAAAVAAARAAGALQKTRLWSELAIQFKGAADLVTEVDRQCEELIVGQLTTAFPDHDILAEENTYADRQARCKWIIDPLDGTTNYAHGFPWFAVSIALEVAGEIRLGVIYHPMQDELFTAVKGAGAFLNGRRLAVSVRFPLINALLATGFPYDRGPGSDDNFTLFRSFQLAARGIRRAGAAALDLAYVACGRFDGFWESHLKPWDVAAGKLLVEEAGGCVTNHAGEPYSVYDHRILATNGVLQEAMLAVLRAGGR